MCSVCIARFLCHCNTMARGEGHHTLSLESNKSEIRFLDHLDHLQLAHTKQAEVITSGHIAHHECV